MLIRAYLGSEFVVANNIAKWKKLEPNEIFFSQGFSQKGASSCLYIFIVFKYLPASDDFCCLLITFIYLFIYLFIYTNSLDPDQARKNVGSGLGPNFVIP